MRTLLVVLLAASLFSLAPPATAQVCDPRDVTDETVVEHVQCHAARAECYARSLVEPVDCTA